MQSLPDQQIQALDENDDAEIQSRLTNSGPGYFAMDEAFCARIALGDRSGARKCADWCNHRARN
jgi:hypothetical protein